MQKTLITYLGGSGGDLLTASLNNIQLSFLEKNLPTNRVSYSIKQHEDKIITKELDLTSLLSLYKQQFISTHLYNELDNLTNSKISLLCTDEKIIEKIILRQMQIQYLSIEINPEEKFFSIIFSLCKKQLFKQAAKIWFEMSRELWKGDMKNRLKKTLNNNTTIYIDEIFTSHFYNSILEQKKILKLGTLKENHHRWLKKNDQYDYEKTISAMESKLSTMDWTQQKGIIKYSQLGKL
jgi:hypothetical protein